MYKAIETLQKKLYHPFSISLMQTREKLLKVTHLFIYFLFFSYYANKSSDAVELICLAPDLVWLLQVQMKWFYLIEIVPIRISELLKLGRYDVGFGLYELKYDKFGIVLLSSEMNIMFCLWSIGNGFLLSMYNFLAIVISLFVIFLTLKVLLDQ